MPDGEFRVMSRAQTNGRGEKSEGSRARWGCNMENRSNLIAEFSPTNSNYIGAVVSKVLEAEMKWPNDIISRKGEKMGGPC